MAPLESAKVKAITRYLESIGAWYVKTTGVSKVGCPDLLCCYKGFFLAIEVKREHDGSYGVTPKQALELQRINRAGGGYVVAVEVDDVRELINIIDAREAQWC